MWVLTFFARWFIVQAIQVRHGPVARVLCPGPHAIYVEVHGATLNGLTPVYPVRHLQPVNVFQTLLDTPYQ